MGDVFVGSSTRLQELRGLSHDIRIHYCSFSYCINLHAPRLFFFHPHIKRLVHETTENSPFYKS